MSSVYATWPLYIILDHSRVQSVVFYHRPRLITVLTGEVFPSSLYLFLAPNPSFSSLFLPSPCSVFQGVRQNVLVTRYHSLAGDPATLPNCLEVTATTSDGTLLRRAKEAEGPRWRSWLRTCLLDERHCIVHYWSYFLSCHLPGHFTIAFTYPCFCLRFECPRFRHHYGYPAQGILD